jgi:hypothetical protein
MKIHKLRVIRESKSIGVIHPQKATKSCFFDYIFAFLKTEGTFISIEYYLID